MSGKQNLTVHLDRSLIIKAKVLAAKQGTSISGLVAQTIARLVEEDDTYERARDQALALLDRGFRLGGKRTLRDELHER